MVCSHLEICVGFGCFVEVFGVTVYGVEHSCCVMNLKLEDEAVALSSAAAATAEIEELTVYLARIHFCCEKEHISR